MTRTIARRLALGVALALACSPAMAQAVTQHGAAQTPGGVQLQITPQTIFNYACNGGSGGIVGETYNGAVCTPDANNASYSSASTITVGGGAIAATRGAAADCTAGGVLTLTMAGGGSLNWTVAPGHQNQPYSITGVSASTATCSIYGLK